MEGRNVVLTLKDKGVLDEDEDTLVNVNMVDDERYKKVCIVLFSGTGRFADSFLVSESLFTAI